MITNPRTRRYRATPKGKATARRYWLKTKFGITPEQYDDMLKAQDGKCAICGDPPTEARQLAVDHCHETNKVRALLCHVCNNFLGVFEARRAAFEAYLANFG